MNKKSEPFHCKMDYTTADYTEHHSRVSYRTIIKKDNRYLVIRSKYGDCIFPGGGIEEGETPSEALYRELKEETGYLASSEYEFLGECILKKDDKFKVGSSYEIACRYYTCEVEDQPVARSLTPSEIALKIEAIWMTKEEILATNEAYSKLLRDRDYWVEQIAWLMERIE